MGDAMRRARRRVREAPLRLRAKAAAVGPDAAATAIRVSYGFGRIPRDGAHGGMVKVQRLHVRFPNSPWRFNVLYLVSSRIPPGAAALLPLVRAGRVALVWNQNGVAYPAWHGPGWEGVNAEMAVMLRAATHVIYQSRFCQESADRFLGPARAPSEVLYNAVDTTRFVPVPGGVVDRPLTLLVGGTQDAAYRVTVALDVLARVARARPDVRMLVLGRLRWGRAPALAEAQRYAVRLGVSDRVTFVGPYAQADAPSLYARGDLLLHPKYNDPSPGLVIEALACGLPVVYSASGGVPEMVGDAGIGIPTEQTWERAVVPDAAAMAAAVLSVAERRKELSEAARQRAVERFDLAPWLARHEAIFARALAQRREA
jgi:glycosyltransferase involved in cell wall biosynthesis